VLEEQVPAKALNLQKGSRVRLRVTGQEGEVAAVSEDSAEVIFGTKRLQVGLDQLEAISPDEDKDTKKSTVRIMRSPALVMPIKLVGLRVDEALPMVEKALDRAMLTGQERIEIIHGAGTGRLKKAIRDYLKELPCVRSYSDSPMEEGGGNKTIVMLGTK
jgi:DNA mismatch repair protein MutS2